jgi:hypothetical protein
MDCFGHFGVKNKKCQTELTGIDLKIIILNLAIFFPAILFGRPFLATFGAAKMADRVVGE